MEYKEWIQLVADGIEIAGTLIIIIGILAATGYFIARIAKTRDIGNSYDSYRRSLVRSILLGLEFLVAGDIIRTIAVPPTFSSIGILVLIVLIRSFLAIELEMEIEGRWPWQRKRSETSRST